MYSRKLNRLPNLERVRRFLRVISLGKFVAIVEGKRDKEALKLFGFDNRRCRVVDAAEGICPG